MNNNWHDYFFNILKTIKTKSKDPNTQFGCIIVGPDHEIRSTGYNSFPRGLNDNVPERLLRPEKYYWFEHSERNAIYNAARMGTMLKGCNLYVDGIPCIDCARGIIQVGIEKIIYDEINWKQYCTKQLGKTEKTWYDLINKTLVMLDECGVEIEAYDTGERYV